MHPRKERLIFLYPSSIFAHRDPCAITTVLGSCVSVCLWDSKLKYGGMNHYMLGLWNGNELPFPKYGDIAIEKLIKKMIDLGSSKKNLQSKIFGGAGQFSSKNAEGFTIGDYNIKIAVDMLREEKIPVVNFSVGGKKGRKIIFYTQTGEVLMKYISPESPEINNLN